MPKLGVYVVFRRPAKAQFLQYAHAIANMFKEELVVSIVIHFNNVD